MNNEDEENVSIIRGEFVVIKDYGNDTLAEQYSVTNPQKAKGSDHIVYTLTVIYYFSITSSRALTKKECSNAKEDIKSSICWEMS